MAISIAALERGMHISELIQVAKDIGRALDHAHAKGVIHRDIKPENILFREDGSAVLTDFGIARLVSPDVTLTRHGTVVGTPQYMSPEQASGKPLDGRSDLYSLGVVFFRMITGDVPYKAESAVAVGVKHVQEPIPKLPSYLGSFQPIINRCLAKDPAARFQSGAELAAALDSVESTGELPNTTVRTQAVTTDEIRAVGSSMIRPVRDSNGRQVHDRRNSPSIVRQWAPAALLTLLLLGVTWVLTQETHWVTRTLAELGLNNDEDIRQQLELGAILAPRPKPIVGRHRCRVPARAGSKSRAPRSATSDRWFGHAVERQRSRSACAAQSTVGRNQATRSAGCVPG